MNTDISNEDFPIGLNHLLKNPTFSITSCYSVNESTPNDKLNGKLISINSGLVSLIKIPNEKPLVFIGLIEISNNKLDHPKPTSNDEIISLVTNKHDVSLIEYDTLLECKKSKQTLKDTFERLWEHFKENEEYIIQITKDAAIQKTEVTQEVLLQSFLHFIEFIDTRIYPKI